MLRKAECPERTSLLRRISEFGEEVNREFWARDVSSRILAARDFRYRYFRNMLLLCFRRLIFFVGRAAG